MSAASRNRVATQPSSSREPHIVARNSANRRRRLRSRARTSTWAGAILLDAVRARLGFDPFREPAEINI